MQDLPRQGPIADIFFPRLVARLHREGFEGTVRVTLHDTTKVIYFKKGEIASAASNAESDRLANLLIRDARLTEAQMEMAQSRLQPGGSLGKTLIEMGFLTPSELLQGARRQVREILSSCLSLSTGAYEVLPGPLPGEVTSLGLATKRLLLDCLVQTKDRRWIIREMRSMESVHKPTEALVPGLDELKLDFEMDRIGRMLDGTLSLRDISSRTSLDDFTVSKVVLAFHLLGMSERVGAPMEAESEGDRGRTIVIESDAPQSEPELAQPAQAEAEGPFIVLEDVPAVAAHAAGSPASAGEARSPGKPDPPTVGIAVALDESLPEPPPIPREELPAFAQPPGEPDQTIEWQVDPETGERVHLGPVEVTFEGRVESREGESRIPVRLLAIAGAVTIALAAVIYLLALRRAGEPTAQEPIAQAPVAPAAPATAAPLSETLDVSPPAPALPPPVPALPPPAAAAPAPVIAEAGPRPSLAADPRYLAALGRLDAGDPIGAARSFEELIAAQNPGGHTLQLLIACQEETLRNTRALSGEGAPLFFLRYSLRGRECYRACWGIYESKEAALADVSSLPPALAAAGTAPIVIRIPGHSGSGER